MAIRIDFLSNTRAAIAGVEDYGDALDEVGSSLDDVARDAQRSGERIEDSLEGAGRGAERSASDIESAYDDAARDGERSAERLERSFREASDATARASENASRSLAHNYASGARQASEGVQEFGDEANSTARESAASFDGSAESIVSSFQEIAANAFAGFGPAGAVAGLAAAAGIGIAMAQFEKGGEATEKFRERVSELTQELIDVGDSQVSLEYVVDKLKEMATATDDAEVSLDDLRDVSDKSGGSYKDLARAMSGAGENLDQLIDSEKARKKALEESNDEEQRGLAYRDQVGGDDPRIAQTQKYIDYLEQAQQAQRDAEEQERNYAEANGPELAAKAELISNINDAYDDAAGAAEDYVNEETGIFDVQGFIDAMAQRKQALIEYQETLATSALSPDARAFISSQGIESAATFMAGYKTATPAQQAELNRIWSEAGKTSSGAFATSTQAKLDNAGYSAEVDLTPNDAAVKAFLSRKLTVPVELRPYYTAAAAGGLASITKRVP